MKRLTVFKAGIVLAVLLFALTSCGLFSPLADYLGIMLKVDGAGHFKEDIEYRSGDDVYRFTPEGTVEYYDESYEDAGQDHDGDGIIGEGWVKTSGYQGTYTWNKDNFVLTEIVQQFILNGEWSNVTNQATFATPMYFTETQWGYVYLEAGENIWQSIYTTDIQNTSTETEEETITLTETSYEYHYKDEEKNTSGTVIYGYEVIASGPYTLLPAGVKWKKGNTVTVLATITLIKEKYFNNTVANAWDPSFSEDNDQNRTSINLFHAGNFVVYFPTVTAFRGIPRQ